MLHPCSTALKKNNQKKWQKKKKTHDWTMVQSGTLATASNIRHKSSHGWVDDSGKSNT